jgi:hypothetical protein
LARAQELADQNRLFRQAASAAGQDDLTAFLDDLERMLVELSHSPSELADLDELHRRLDDLDLLFKVRVVVERLHREAGADRRDSTPRREV